MILFHGTSDKFLKSIQKHGLVPRGLSGKSTYEGKLESLPDRVYLTDVYAPQFGLIAVDKHGGNLMIVGVKVEESRLLPDSDFEEDGKHHHKFTCGLECLKSTGTASMIGTVQPIKIWCLGKKQTDDIKEKASRRIETGFRHRGFYQMHENQLGYCLMMARKEWKNLGDNDWVDW